MKTDFSMLSLSLAPLIVLALLLLGAPVRAELEVYGKMQAEYYVEQVGERQARGVRFSVGSDRFGIKGSDRQHDNRLIFQTELTPESARPCAQVGANSYGGLSGSWGTLLIGPHSTPMQISTGKTHLNSQTLLTTCDLIGASGQPRTGILYIPTIFSGISVAALLPFTNTEIVEDLAYIYNDGPFYLSLGDQTFRHADGIDRQRTAFTLNMWDWNGITLGFYHGWQRRIEPDDTPSPFAWPEDQQPEREAWRIEFGYNFGNSGIKVQTGRVVEADDKRTVGFSSAVFEHNFSKRRKAFSGQMRTLIERPGREPQEQITETMGLRSDF